MRVSTLRSIRAKLFYMTTSLVVMTVVGNSWQNAAMFNRQVARQAQDGTLDAAKERSAAAAGTLDNWRIEIALVVNAALSGGDSASQLRAIEAFLAVNTEAVALQLFKQTGRGDVEPTLFAFTKAQSTARFEGQDSEKVAKALKTGIPKLVAAKVRGARKDRAQVASATSIAKLPLLLLLLPYRTSEGAQHWAALTLWTSRLVAAMPASALTRSKLVTANGDILAAPQLERELAQAATAGTAALRRSLASGSPTGMLTYTDTQGDEWHSAFSRLDAFDAAVVIERNTKAQQLATSQIVRRSALWGWGFVLVAILFSYFGAGGMTAQLRALTRATGEIAAGNLKAVVPAKGRDEVTVLGAAVTHMAQRIDVLLHEQVAKAEMQKELETAQAVQSALFPKAIHEATALTTRGFYQPATQCGGDWWGTYRCRDGSEFVFIGDATGHGAGPALVTAMAYTCCQTLPELLEAMTSDESISPAALLTRMNELIWGATGGQIAMTFIAVHIDPTRGMMRYSNAGHNFPLLYRKRPEVSGEVDGEPAYQQVTLRGGGTPLGIERASHYTDLEQEFGAGDYLVCFTDGLIECFNSDRKAWGKRRLMSTAQRAIGQGAESLIQAIRDEAMTYFGTTPLADDVTIVVTELRQSGAVKAGAA
jgi:serine phosphatase RsbU (regulator of sigma subunit)